MSGLYPRARDALSRPVASSVALFLCFITLCWLYFRPWSSVLLLDPNHYHATLRRTLNESFPANLYPELVTGLNWLESPNATIPAHIFQTDKNIPSASDAESWIRHGFNRTFLDDSQAAQWVEEHFSGSEIARVYHDLPLPVMKADMLRYLLLLIHGGVYSDVDTRALMPISMWASDAKPWPAGQWVPHPRIIVGIEGGARNWRDLGSLMDLTGFKRGPRHRYFQFVQWTFASKALHPILVDTVRRIIETSTLARAWKINRARQIDKLVADGNKSAARNLEREPAPWEADTIGDRLSVQEWTGPAAFTDSVLSYLFAVAHVRQEDLYAVDGPTQFVDVVVLPMDGFNPIPSQLPRRYARVVHLFRGSWKKRWRGMKVWGGS